MDDFFELVGSSFEESVSELGFSLYSKGRVQELTPVGASGWTAVVEGRPNQRVRVSGMRSPNMTVECTCPRQGDRPCAHIAAALMAIIIEGDEIRALRPPPELARLAQYKKAMRRASRQDLAQFVLGLTERDVAIGDALLFHFGRLFTRQACIELIEEALESPLQTILGDFEWENTDDRQRMSESVTSSRLMQLLYMTASWIEDGERMADVIRLLQAIVTVIGSHLITQGEESGLLTRDLQEAVVQLYDTVSATNARAQRGFFDELLQLGSTAAAKNYSWGFDLLHLASLLGSTKEQYDRMLARLDRLPDAVVDKEYERTVYRHSADLQREFIKAVEGQEAELVFMRERVDVPEFVQSLLEHYTENDMKGDAVQLCKEVLALPEAIAGYKSEVRCRQYLKALSDRTGDKQMQIELLRSDAVNMGSRLYINALRDPIEPEEWPEYYERMLRDMRHKMIGIYGLTDLLVEDGRWDEIVQMVREGFNYPLGKYRNELQQRYAGEIMDSYEQTVRNLLQTTRTRKKYSEAADYLLRIKAMGDRQRADGLVDEFCATYEKRRAMIEELARVKSAKYPS